VSVPATEPATDTAAYADHLEAVQGQRWKRFAPNPYRWFLRRRRLGFTLDLGAGLGRSLGYIDGNGVGVDHNPEAVRRCRQRGFSAFTPEEFHASAYARPGRFDALLVAHVLEHNPPAGAAALLDAWLPFVRSGGRALLITPQEKGFAAEDTHVWFADTEALSRLCVDAGLLVRSTWSFPLPRWAGPRFAYNEFVVEAAVPAAREAHR
jgi:SAM-dependent methyltransferase